MAVFEFALRLTTFVTLFAKLAIFTRPVGTFRTRFVGALFLRDCSAFLETACIWARVIIAAFAVALRAGPFLTFMFEAAFKTASRGIAAIAIATFPASAAAFAARRIAKSGARVHQML